MHFDGDTREWLPRLVSSGPIGPIPFHPNPSHPIATHPSIGPRSLCPRGSSANGIKNTLRNVWGAAADGISHPVGLFIVSGLNSEACLNSEMNLWINTIMVIWHPLWVAAATDVCRPKGYSPAHSHRACCILVGQSHGKVHV